MIENIEYFQNTYIYQTNIAIGKIQITLNNRHTSVNSYRNIARLLYHALPG